MKRLALLLLAGAYLLGAQPALAHFGMIIPERALVGAQDPKTLGVQLRFWHPMENQGLELGKPSEAGYLVDGQKTDLLPALSQGQVQGHSVWAAKVAIKKPGDYLFYMTPPAYFEPAEDKFIIHYTKTVVGVLNKQESWDTPLGQKMEIVPLTRPYGLYAGNVFSGQVLFHGKPLANCRVEVEFFNTDGKRYAPAEAFVSQVVKTDSQGDFTWGLPWPGWWGFAALTDDGQPLKKDGMEKKLELGGVLWIQVQGSK